MASTTFGHIVAGQALLLSTLVVCQRAGSGDGSEDASLPSAALEAWRALDDESPIRAVTLHVDKYSPDGTRTSRETIKARGASRVIITEALEKGQLVGQAWGRNDRYVFSVRRKQAESRWVLTYLRLAEHAESGADADHMLEANDKALRVFPLAMSHFSLGVLVGHPSFELTEVRREALGVFVFQFRVDPKGEAASRRQFHCNGGRVVLDPEKSWLPVEFELRYPETERVLVGRNSDFRLHDGIWLPWYKSLEARDSDGKVIPVSSARVEELTIREAVPEGEFTLTAFGLPEPPGAPTQISIWLWVGIGGLLFLLTAALLRLRKPKRATPGA